MTDPATPIRQLRHPGNLAYVWALDARTRRGLPEALPYPTAQHAVAA